MKSRVRWLALLMAGLMVLAACGEGEDPRDEPEDAGTQEPDGGDVPDGGDGSDGGEPSASGETVQLVMESWRNDDLAIWEDTILPAFTAQHPNIEVVFQPTAPDEYNAALEAKLSGGTAGDLITCRPYDVSVALFEDGHLESLNDLPGIEAFGDVARSAWQTDDASDVFCVPMASAMHGFFYNTDIFDELGLEVPATISEFHEVLDAVADDGTYTPLAMGTADQWEAATMGLQNIGPNFWEGEEGRARLIAGEEGWDDPQYVAAFEELASWSDYLPAGFESITYPDAQNLFTLGQSAIYPTGSWEIALFREQADFELGVFPPPTPDGQDACFISDHPDIAVGMNPATAHPEETLTFLEWTATTEFFELYANSLPGFLPLADADVELEDPLAQQFVDWRNDCNSTIRNAYQFLSRGEPNLENELWDLSAQVINGTMEPQAAGDRAQQALDSWYDPTDFQ